MKRIHNIIYLLVFAFAITSCAIQKPNLESDTKVKQMEVPKDKAIVYIVRPKYVGKVLRFPMSCNNNYIGSTFGRNFLYVVLEPGKYSFKSYTENIASFKLNVESNKIYYLEQLPRMGWFYSRSKIVQLDEITGKKKLYKCKLSGDCSTD